MAEWVARGSGATTKDQEADTGLPSAERMWKTQRRSSSKADRRLTPDSRRVAGSRGEETDDGHGDDHNQQGAGERVYGRVHGHSPAHGPPCTRLGHSTLARRAAVEPPNMRPSPAWTLHRRVA